MKRINNKELLKSYIELIRVFKLPFARLLSVEPDINAIDFYVNPTDPKSGGLIARLVHIANMKPKGSICIRGNVIPDGYKPGEDKIDPTAVFKIYRLYMFENSETPEKTAVIKIQKINEILKEMK